MADYDNDLISLNLSFKSSLNGENRYQEEVRKLMNAIRIYKTAIDL